VVRALALSGQRFGRLVVVSRAPSNRFGQSRWDVVCDCGGTRTVDGSKLVSGHTQSCGCLSIDTVRTRSSTHGQGSRKHRSRASIAWKEMKRRIKRDPHYVGKVSICSEWFDSYEAFFRDMGPCPDGWELDRIDNSVGYYPNNCRWVDETRQSRNRSYCKLNEEKAAQIRGSSKTTKELTEEFGVSRSTIKKTRRGGAWR